MGDSLTWQDLGMLAGFVVMVVVGLVKSGQLMAKREDPGSKPSGAPLLLMDDQRVRNLADQMGLLTMTLTRMTTTLERVIEGQEATQRALTRNSTAAESVREEMPDLRVSMNSMTNATNTLANIIDGRGDLPPLPRRR